jgi:tetratricopeptide (TPR) repeat protein
MSPPRCPRVIIWSASVLVLAASIARAQPGNGGCGGVRQAKAQFELGQAHIKLGEYELAMIDFEAGYACIPLPLFLYDIAQMARMSGQRSKALEYYKRYLQAEPNAREKPYVLRWIAALSPHGKSKAPPPEPAAEPEPPARAPVATTAPATGTTTSPMVIAPTMTTPPPSLSTTAPGGAGAPAASTTGAPGLTASADLTRSSTASERPSRRTRWIVLGVVGGALVIGGAITAGVLLSQKSSGVPSGFHDLGPIDAFAPPQK